MINNIWDDLVAHCIKEAAQHIDIHLSPSERVLWLDVVACNGFYCDKTKQLKVATLNPHWKHTLVHEFCHWRQDCDGKSIGDGDELDHWLDHKVELPPEKVQSLCLYHADIEADCEGRVIALMREFSAIPEEIDAYNRRAMAYVMFYSTIASTRQWYIRAPYEVPEILEFMRGPDAMTVQAIPEYMHLLIKHGCINA